MSAAAGSESGSRSGAVEDGAEVASEAADAGTLLALVRDRGAVLIDGLDRHLPGAREHAAATGDYAFAAAVELGHGRERAELIREVAKLHEIGKVYLPAELLERPVDELSDEERARLDEHHEAGARLARGAGLPEAACGWILRVREHYDGQGPEHLAAEGIPIESRIARVACAFDRALCAPALADRGAADRRQAAVEAVRGGAGDELDPNVVAALATVVERAVPG